MRTTIRIDDALLEAAKVRAARSGRTVGEVIEDALRLLLARDDSTGRPPVDLPVYGGSGTLPGVDLSSNAALADVMDTRDVDALR